MSDASFDSPDLSGTAVERQEALATALENGTPSPGWLRRQLEQTLADWAALESRYLVEKEGDEDF